MVKKMFVKLIGMSTVMLSTILIGYCMNEKYKNHIIELKNLVLCMEAFENEIRYNSYDIITALKKIKNTATFHNAIVFDSFYRNAQNSDGEQLSVVWEKSLAEVSDKLCFDKDDILEICNFGKILGSGDSETQIKNIRNFINSLKDNIETAETKSAKNGNIFSKLGIYFGLLIAVLLF